MQQGQLSFDDKLGYCFVAGSLALRLSVVSGVESTYNKIGKFQDHFIGLESSVGANQHGLLKIAVASLTTLSPEDEAVFKPATAGSAANHKDFPIHVESQIVAGRKLSGSDPLYPQAAKQNRERGVVILGATINEQGLIQNAKILEAPTPTLGNASLEAIRTWKYQPYLLNGSPVKVQTTIDVVFRLGR